MTKTPTPKMAVKMSFRLHGKFDRMNSEQPIASMIMSLLRLNTAFVIRWFVAALHWMFGVGRAQ